MKPARRPEPRLPDLLVKNRNFVFLWLAYGIAAIGDHLSEMALLQERGGLERPDATRIQALISFGFFLPFVVLGPIAGWWSDRFSRRTTMIAADVLRALLVFNLAVIVVQLEVWFEPDRFPGAPALVSWFGGLPQRVAEPRPGWGDMAIVVPLAIVGCLAAFFSPARQALLPTLIRPDQLTRANALINALGTIGGITGGVLGGALAVRFKNDLHYNYYLNSLTFALSALFVFCIAMSRTRAVPHPKLEGVWTPMVQGFRYVNQHRRVAQMILLGAVFWGAAGVVISVVPAVVRDVFGGNVSDVAIFRGLIVIGLAVGAGVMSIIGPSLPLQIAVVAGLCGGGLWVLGLNAAYMSFHAAPGAAAGPFSLGGVITGICLFGIGGAGAALLVTIMTTLQRFVPDSRRGRVFGVSDTTTMGAMVLASGVLGLAPIPNLDRYIPWLLGGTGLMLLASMVFAWREYRRRSTVGPVLGVMLLLVRFYARFWCRAKRVGPCTLPTSGPVILASNHTAGVDPILIQAASPHRVVSFLVERRQYQRSVLGYFMRLAHCIPVDRERPGRAWLSESLRALRDGRVVGIFPQGTFVAPDAAAPEARPGAGAIALRTGATVIPCHIRGTRFHDSPLASFFVRHNVRVRFGRPVDLSSLRGRERERGAADEATALIMQRVFELGQE